MTFTGTISAINAALDGLLYAVPEEWTDFLTIAIDDGDLTDDDMVTIMITTP